MGSGIFKLLYILCFLFSSQEASKVLVEAPGGLRDWDGRIVYSMGVFGTVMGVVSVHRGFTELVDYGGGLMGWHRGLVASSCLIQ